MKKSLGLVSLAVPGLAERDVDFARHFLRSFVISLWGPVKLAMPRFAPMIHGLLVLIWIIVKIIHHLKLKKER